jgi:hypothetical protein
MCRAHLVPQYEGAVSVCTEFLLPCDELPVATSDVLPPAASPSRAAWLVLTANALSLYESASRRERLAVFPLRRLCDVEEALPAVLAPPPAEALVGLPHQRARQQHGLVVFFVGHLPESERRPRLPLPPELRGARRYARFSFRSVATQTQWVQNLKQAICPIAAVLQSTGVVPTSLDPTAHIRPLPASPALVARHTEGRSSRAARPGTPPLSLHGITAHANLSLDGRIATPPRDSLPPAVVAALQPPIGAEPLARAAVNADGVPLGGQGLMPVVTASLSHVPSIGAAGVVDPCAPIGPAGLANAVGFPAAASLASVVANALPALPGGQAPHLDVASTLLTKGVVPSLGHAGISPNPLLPPVPAGAPPVYPPAVVPPLVPPVAAEQSWAAPLLEEEDDDANPVVAAIAAVALEAAAAVVPNIID